MTPVTLLCATVATADPAAEPGTPNLTIQLLPVSLEVTCPDDDCDD